MRPAIACAFVALVAAGCRDFDEDFQTCVRTGHCVADGGMGGGGGSGGGVGGGGGGGGVGGGGVGGGSVVGGGAGGGSGGGGGGTSLPDAGDGCDPISADGGTSIQVRHFALHVLQTSMELPVPVGNVAGAWAWDGGSFTFSFLPAADLDAGWRIIRDAPANYTVEYVDSSGLRGFVVGTSRNLDLSQYVLGRDDTVLIGFDGGTPTILEVDAGGLSPWAPRALLELVCANAGIGFAEIETFFGDGGTNPAPNSTQALIPVDWYDTLSPANLIDSSKGDTTYLLQFTQARTDAGVPYRFADRWDFNTSLQMTAGTTSRAAFELAPLPRDRTFHSRYFAGEFSQAADLAQGDDGGFLSIQLVGVDPIPGGSARGFYSGLPDMFFTDFTESDGGQLWRGVDGGIPLDVDFGSPFPTAWTPLVTAKAQAQVVRKVPRPDGGVAQNVGIPTFVSIEREYADFADGGREIHPEVGPVARVTLDGNPFPPSANLTNVSLTPDVIWDPPTLGTPTSYAMVIYRLDSRIGATPNGTRVALARVSSPTPEFRIPPGVLAPGKYYVLRISSQLFPRVEYCRAPLFTTLPGASATYVTHVFQTRDPYPDGG